MVATFENRSSWIVSVVRVGFSLSRFICLSSSRQYHMKIIGLCITKEIKYHILFRTIIFVDVYYCK
jgi:hypothetical protein